MKRTPLLRKTPLAAVSRSRGALGSATLPRRMAMKTYSKPAHTRAEQQHLDAVQSLGCIACMILGYEDTPACIHHVRRGQGMGQRASHFEVLPLCPWHHQDGPAGEAFHEAPTLWQTAFGTEDELLAKVARMLREKRIIETIIPQNLQAS